LSNKKDSYPDLIVLETNAQYKQKSVTLQHYLMYTAPKVIRYRSHM